MPHRPPSSATGPLPAPTAPASEYPRPGTDPNRGHPDLDRSEATDPGPSTGPGWLDRLVELRVLAEHGDPTAAAEVAHWIDRDPDAERIWRQLTHDHALLTHPDRPT